MYLFSTTDLSQFIKLPVLAQHFFEHRDQDKEISIWKFLYLHYANDHGEDADHHRDMQLPFKSPDNCITTVFSHFLPSQKIVVKASVQFIGKKDFAPRQSILYSTFIPNIWQPPRVS